LYCIDILQLARQKTMYLTIFKNIASLLAILVVLVNE